MSSGGATTQSTRWKDSSGSAGNVMSAILPCLIRRATPTSAPGRFGVVGASVRVQDAHRDPGEYQKLDHLLHLEDGRVFLGEQEDHADGAGDGQPHEAA